MPINRSNEIKSSELTDKKVYLTRRLFMRGVTILGTTAATGLLYRKLNPPTVEIPKGQKLSNFAKSATGDGARQGFSANETLTPLEDITNYNNFYEFSTDKRSVAFETQGFVTRPWTVAVE